MSPLQDTTGSRFTCQMHSLPLYLEARRASQNQHVRHWTNELCPPPSWLSARLSSECARSTVQVRPQTPQVTLCVSLLPHHHIQAVTKACRFHFLNIHNLITSPQPLSSLLIACIIAKGQVVFLYPLVPTHTLNPFPSIERERSLKKCKSENIVPLLKAFDDLRWLRIIIRILRVA